MSKNRLPFKTIQEFTMSSAHRLAMSKGTASYALFENSTNPIYQNVYNTKIKGGKLIDCSQVDVNCFREFENDKYVVLLSIVSNFQSYRENNNCIGFVMPQQIDNNIISLGINKNSPFKPYFDSKIVDIVDSGLFEQWRKRYNRQGGDCGLKTIKVDLGANVITFTETLGIMLVLFLGLLVSTTVFVLEMVIGHWSLIKVALYNMKNK